MLSFNIIFICCIVVLLFFIRGYMEPFSDLPAAHKNYVADMQAQHNELSATVNIVNAVIPQNSDGAAAISDAISTATLIPTAGTPQVQMTAPSALPSRPPEIIVKAQKVCEAAPKDCSAFGDAAFASTCGMSFDKKGQNSKGLIYQGGLYVSPDDRTDQMAAGSKIKTERSGDPYAVYQPTIGAAAPGTFSLNSGQCTVVKEKVDCETNQSFGTKNCSQCYTSGTFSRVDPQSDKVPTVLRLFGSGTVSVSSTDSTIVLPDTALRANGSSDVAFPSASEGKMFYVSVRAASAGVAPFVYGYLEGATTTGVMKIDLFKLIQLDEAANAKPRIMGTKSANGLRTVAMMAGQGKTTMRLRALMPFTFLQTAELDTRGCNNGPFITKAESATFLESDPCYGKANSPGNYKMECLQSRWMQLGGTEQGTGYPRDAATANTIQRNSGGGPVDIDTITDALADKSSRAYSGTTADGTSLSIPEWNKVSMYMTGVPINTPCDGPTSKTGPLSQDCLKYLYKNRGEASHVGSTYSLPPAVYAVDKSGFTDFALKETVQEGFFDALEPGANPSTATGVQFAGEGNVDAVKAKYDATARCAYDDSKTNEQRQDCIQKMVGANLLPNTSNENNFDVVIGAGQATKSYSDMKAVCEGKGMRLCASNEICDMKARVVANPELTPEFKDAAGNQIDNWIAVSDKENEWLTLNRGGDRYCKTHTAVAGAVPGWSASRDATPWMRLAKCCPKDDGVVRAQYVRLQYNRVDCLNLGEIRVYTSPSDTSQIVTPSTVVTRSSGGHWQNIFPERNFVDGNDRSFVHTSCGDVPWVMLNLGAMTPIYKVIVTNRQDCCLERILGTSLILLDSVMKPVYNSVPINSVNAMYTWFPPGTGVYPDFKGAKPNPPYRHAGCWADTGDRAVPTLEGDEALTNTFTWFFDRSYKNRFNAVEKCYQAAKQKGMKVFAVQDGGWCAASKDINSYRKYGTATNCSAGKGGGWANDVYVMDEVKSAPTLTVGGNNGTTTCERYCSGVNGQSWNGVLPKEWNGAACAGVGANIRDCYSRFDGQGGDVSCTCKATGSGWRQGGFLNS